MKRGQSNLNFLLPINKPKGMTSHDVVSKLRYIFNEKRIGHMGTLDPLATGLLLIGVGSATRLNQFLEDLDKKYIVEINFGRSTTTYDAEGEICDVFEVPSKISDIEFAREYITNIIGPQMQKPPIYSAIKKNGKVAYKEARKGKDIKLPLRDIEIYNAKLLDCNEDKWSIELHVSKGTYVRSIAHDIGQDLGCGAFVSKLKRIAISNVLLDNAYNLEWLESINDYSKLSYVDIINLINADYYVLDNNNLTDVLCGKQICIDDKKSKKVKNFLCAIMDKKVYGIYEPINDEKSIANKYKAKCVFPKGIDY